MRRNDVPTVREPRPGLHLPAELPWHRVSMKQRGGGGEVTAIGGDDGARQAACESHRRPRGAEGTDLVPTMQDFVDAVAYGVWTAPEQILQGGDVVADQRGFIAGERRRNFSHDLGQVDLHAHPLCPSSRGCCL